MKNLSLVVVVEGWVGCLVLTWGGKYEDCTGFGVVVVLGVVGRVVLGGKYSVGSGFRVVGGSTLNLLVALSNGTIGL